MDILFFPNGNTAVFENEEQIPELQEGWLNLFAEFLVRKGIDPTLANITLPDQKKAKIFRTPNGFNWNIK